MLVVGGFVIIMGMTIAMGFYSSLAHCGPKAVLDGAVIALLMHKSRWRCLSLAAIVYGLVLLLQLGNPYVFAVIALSGLIAASVGRVLSPISFGLAVGVAAVVYEIFAGFGMPIRIWLSTDGNEPILWGMWFAEWPLRMIGAIVGVWLAMRFLRDRAANDLVAPVALRVPSETPPTSIGMPQIGDVTAPSVTSIDSATPARDGVSAKSTRGKGRLAAGLRIGMSFVACFLPMLLNSWVALSIVAGLYLMYGVMAGLRWRALQALAGLVYGWVVFAGASYLWHQDFDRVIDLLRTFVLRFIPLAVSSAVLVLTVRPVDVVRLLRTIRTPGVIILPLSHVFRGIPHSRRQFGASIARLRRDGVWRGPLSIFRRPRAIARGLLGPQFRRWANELAD